MTRRVLVVDDDPQIREVLEMRLEAMGLAVTTTGSPQEALTALEAGGFDVALFDLKMEPMDGIALMEAAHERQRGLPVLIMTAYGSIENAVAAIQRGAFDYLTKPFLPDELRARVSRALSERRWARDRERLKAVGETLASSGVMERILDAVTQAALETTDAERCAVFLVEKGELRLMSSAGPTRPSWESLLASATSAIENGAPTTLRGTDGRITVATPLIVDGGSVGALVIETPGQVAPTGDDLELLKLFSSQAAVAIKNTQELSRLRSGALAALGRMATQVAHEVKNPLGGLKLYARSLEQRLEASGDSQGAEVTRKIGAAIDHLSELVREITAFGRPVELRRAPISINGLLDECLALVRDRVAGRRINVARFYDAGCPAAPVDAGELRKVVLNLIINGLDAMPDEGTLTMRTAYLPEARAVEIVVEDTGIGMADATRSRIFDPFFTTKPNGTGLGLAIARSVVDLHGGDIQVESEPGRGTSVHVRLPVEASG